MKQTLKLKIIIILSVITLIAITGYAHLNGEFIPFENSTQRKYSIEEVPFTNREKVISIPSNTMAVQSIVAKPASHGEIIFAPNSSQLNNESEQALRSIAHQARMKGDIEQVTIAAWSDKNLPVKDGNLQNPDRILAEQRAMAIAIFLKNDLLINNIDTFNMAQKSNWLAKNFWTTENEMPNLFSKKGSEPPVTTEEFNIIKGEGGAGKAIIVIETSTPN